MKEHGCHPRYKALLMLSAQLLKQSRSCGQKNKCGHPKRCADPWLVRSHFGDMAALVAEHHGHGSLDELVHDVLKASNTSRHTLAFPNGVLDYIKFPEMAELGGMVISRHNAVTEHRNATKDMPTSMKGLHGLAAEMVSKQALINQRLVQRTCQVFGVGHTINNLTGAEWADQIRHGYDLMSDYDSPLSKASFSGMVWKSMGNWRMTPGSEQVYLECRNAQHCIENIGKDFDGPVPLLRRVAEVISDFEQEQIKTRSSHKHKKDHDGLEIRRMVKRSQRDY